MKNNRKAVEERHLKILNMIRERGEVKVEELAELFQISPMTVRRDMQYLEEEKLISRIHGGAVSLEKANMLLSQDEKISICRERISEYASRFIDDGDTLFINGSRTALNMLKYAENKKVMVYTNNCWGIGEKYPDDVTIRFTGGEVRSNVMVGEYVMRNLLSMTADKTFLGCAAVYDDGEFRYDIPTEIGINEAMISRTKKHYMYWRIIRRLRDARLWEMYMEVVSMNSPVPLSQMIMRIRRWLNSFAGMGFM